MNAFDYDYSAPSNISADAFTVHTEIFPSPTRKGYHIRHLRLKGQYLEPSLRRSANPIFVVDVSGSMASENRLGLVKRSLGVLVDQLEPNDTVGIVVYGTNAYVVLEPTPASQLASNLSAENRLSPSGSTNAGQGLRLGHQLATHELAD